MRQWPQEIAQRIHLGPVAAAKPPQSALDVAAAARLWAASEQLTHLPFPTDRKAA